MVSKVCSFVIAIWIGITKSWRMGSLMNHLTMTVINWSHHHQIFWHILNSIIIVIHKSLLKIINFFLYPLFIAECTSESEYGRTDRIETGRYLRGFICQFSPIASSRSHPLHWPQFPQLSHLLGHQKAQCTTKPTSNPKLW